MQTRMNSLSKSFVSLPVFNRTLCRQVEDTGSMFTIHTWIISVRVCVCGVRRRRGGGSRKSVVGAWRFEEGQQEGCIEYWLFISCPLLITRHKSSSSSFLTRNPSYLIPSLSSRHTLLWPSHSHLHTLHPHYVSASSTQAWMSCPSIFELASFNTTVDGYLAVFLFYSLPDPVSTTTVKKSNWLNVYFFFSSVIWSAIVKCSSQLIFLVYFKVHFFKPTNWLQSSQCVSILSVALVKITV